MIPGTHSVRRVEIEFRNASATSRVPRRPSSVWSACEKGEKVCIVMSTAREKATIKLLLRFYDVTRAASCSTAETSGNTPQVCGSSFFQQFVNFAFTLRENIILPIMKATGGFHAPALRAMEKASFQDLLASFPGARHLHQQTVLRRTGRSGGQQQSSRWPKPSTAKAR